MDPIILIHYDKTITKGKEWGDHYPKFPGGESCTYWPEQDNAGGAY